MDFIGYTMDLESLINRYTLLIFAKTVPIILVLLLAWIIPYIDKKMNKKRKIRKTKRKLRLEKESKRNALISQIAVSVLLIVLEVLFVKSDVTTLNNLKKDLNQGSVAVYDGAAYVSAPVHFLHDSVLFDLIVDPRFVTFENSEETYQIDMSNVWEGLCEYSGDFAGKITYGRNSKFILKIE
ncbi:MAG: hypothetical protein IJZ35_01205 [Clostridia bacterium]|nr:hypothetical protein [Clostridia bacterium]